jgi:hypothetical protein
MRVCCEVGWGCCWLQTSGWTRWEGRRRRLMKLLVAAVVCFSVLRIYFAATALG